MSCIVYRDRKFHQHAGRVETKYLTVSFSGREVTIGRANVADITVEVPAVTWSKDSFVGTAEKYAVLMETATNGVQLKLAY